MARKQSKIDKVRAKNRKAFEEQLKKIPELVHFGFQVFLDQDWLRMAFNDTKGLEPPLKRQEIIENYRAYLIRWWDDDGKIHFVRRDKFEHKPVFYVYGFNLTTFKVAMDFTRYVILGAKKRKMKRGPRFSEVSSFKASKHTGKLFEVIEIKDGHTTGTTSRWIMPTKEAYTKVPESKLSDINSNLH